MAIASFQLVRAAAVLPTEKAALQRAQEAANR
jgi:hypothetical protein